MKLRNTLCAATAMAMLAGCSWAGQEPEPELTFPTTTPVVTPTATTTSAPTTTTTPPATTSTTSTTTTTTTSRPKPNPTTSPPYSSNPKPLLDKRCFEDVPRLLCVDKDARKMYYMRGGEAMLVLDIRTARPGYVTNEGSWKVTRKKIDDWSEPYNAPMPYSIYFYGGKAIHYSSEFARVGYGPPYGSHGCVNVRDKTKIAKIFSEIKVGDPVIVY